jgi:hypothetical protein
MSEIIDLPLQTRADARLEAGSIDADARTIEVVWSTGATVQRREWLTGRRYKEELSLEPSHVDLTRLNAGAPFLNSHSQRSLEHVIGVVERAWITGDGNRPEGRALVRISERADVEPLWQDIRAGIIRNVSVGYAVRAYDVIEADGQLPTWRAIDWQPMELSAVPVGADPDATFRERQGVMPCQLIHRAGSAHNEEVQMMDQQDPVAETRAADIGDDQEHQPAHTRDEATVVQPDINAAIAAERARIAGIYDAVRKLGVDSTIADSLVREGASLDAARGVIIDAAASRDRAIETRPHVRSGGLDERETRRAAVEAALLHRYDPSRYELSEPAREWRGLSLLEMARACLDAEGTRVRGFSRDEVATRALHTTSDFPNILAAVTSKTLRDSYQAAPRTFLPIARRATAADFKDIYRVQLGEAPKFEKVNEAGEFRRGTLGEAAERYRIQTYGKVIGITRQIIVNDDLDAFTRIPSLFGTAAATLESDVVWGIITANPNMGDGVALFASGHKNLAASGTALDVANLAKARTAMAKQTGLDGATILNIRPTYIAVPTSLELTAEQLLAANLVPATTANVVPASLRTLTVIAEPRLDPASGAVPWYLFASPAGIDTIEYAYLEGNDGVFIESRVGFDVDGVEIKARLDFGAKAIDWRGVYKNPGV